MSQRTRTRTLLALLLGGGSVVAAAANTMPAKAQSLGDAVSSAIGAGSGAYCRGIADDTATIRDHFGPNLQRICRPFGNVSSGSALGSGGLDALTSTRTVSQRRTVKLRRERDRDRKPSKVRDREQKRALLDYQFAYNGELSDLGLVIEQNNDALTAWLAGEYGNLDRRNTEFAPGYTSENYGVEAGLSSGGRGGAASFSVVGEYLHADGNFRPENDLITEDRLPVAHRTQPIPDPTRSSLKRREIQRLLNENIRLGTPADVCGALGSPSFESDTFGLRAGAGSSVGPVDISADAGVRYAKNSYTRLVCAMQLEITPSADANRVLINSYHGGLVEGSPSAWGGAFSVGAALPFSVLDFESSLYLTETYAFTRTETFSEKNLQASELALTFFPTTTPNACSSIDEGDWTIAETTLQEAYNIRNNLSCSTPPQFAPVTATGLELSFEDSKQESLVTTIGASIAKSVEQDWGVISFSADVSANYEAMDDQQTRHFTFNEDLRPVPASFQYLTDEPDRTWGNISLGISAHFDNGVTPFLSASTIVGHDYYTGYAVNAGVRRQF